MEVRIGCHTHLLGGCLGSQMETWLDCLALWLMLPPSLKWWWDSTGPVGKTQPCVGVADNFCSCLDLKHRCQMRVKQQSWSAVLHCTAVKPLYCSLETQEWLLILFTVSCIQRGAMSSWYLALLELLGFVISGVTTGLRKRRVSKWADGKQPSLGGGTL